MRSLRKIIGAGLAGMALLACAAGISPAFAAATAAAAGAASAAALAPLPQATGQDGISSVGAAPQAATCSAVWAGNCPSGSISARPAAMVAVQAAGQDTMPSATAPQATTCSAVWAGNCPSNSVTARPAALAAVPVETTATAGQDTIAAASQAAACSAVWAGECPRGSSPAVANAAAAGAAAAGPTLAQGQLRFLTGTEQRYFGPPASVWAANGSTQVRGVQLTGDFAFSGPGVTLAGTETVLTNATLDANNNGYTWGQVTYTDKATGLVCSGSVNGKISNALGTLTVVAPCANGALLVGTVQDFATDPPNVAPPKSVKSSFNSVLITPSEAQASAVPATLPVLGQSAAAAASDAANRLQNAANAYPRAINSPATSAATSATLGPDVAPSSDAASAYPGPVYSPASSASSGQNASAPDGAASAYPGPIYSPASSAK